MKKTLVNMDVNTLIGMIPSIVNRNNLIITEALDNIYDSSANYIKVPVNTTGEVSANLGYFLNLVSNSATLGPITFSGDASVLNNFYTTSILFNHDSMFNKSLINQHPISAITNLEDELKKINDKIDSLVNGNVVTSVYRNVPQKSIELLSSDIDSSLVIDNQYIKVYNDDIDMYNYPKSYYTKAPDYTSKKYKSAGDYNDIIYKHKYNYINVLNNYVKINNLIPVALHTNEIGTIVNFIFNNENENDFIIKLSSNKDVFKHIKIKYNDIDLVTLSLICIDINEYGTQWKILNYNGNITIE